jgi:hemolysin activation/secretion protein
VTELNAGVTAGIRGLGSAQGGFENNRHGAEPNFTYVRADLSHTRDLPGDFQAFGKIQGQASDEPLLDSEEFSGGGLGTVRGYLESEVLGDNALFGSAEMRSPSLTSLLGKSVDEWRFYLFGDAGFVAIDDPLPEQASRLDLASVGVGSRLRLEQHFNASLDLAVPLIDGPNTSAFGPRLTFRLWAEF